MTQEGRKDRTILKSRGSWRGAVTKDNIPDDLIQGAHTIHLQASMAGRFGADVLWQVLARRNPYSELVFALATDPAVAKEINGGIRQIVDHQATRTYANDTELLVNLPGDGHGNLPQSVAQLYGSLKAHPLTAMEIQRTATVSRGLDPLLFITADGIRKFPIMYTAKETSRLGAGDARVAGQEAGHAVGLEREDCVDLGSLLSCLTV